MHFMYCDLGYANSHVTHRETKVKGHTLWGTHAAGHAGHKNINLIYTYLNIRQKLYSINMMNTGDCSLAPTMNPKNQKHHKEMNENI